MTIRSNHPMLCRCGATLGHDAGDALILAPQVVVISRVHLRCRDCGAFRWWKPAPTVQERAAVERWQRGKAVEYIEA